MQSRSINEGQNAEKVSDVYLLRQFDKTNAIEREHGIYEVEFNGSVEVIKTLYDYGDFGARSYFLPPTDMYSSFYRGQLGKGTRVSFTGRASYERTENGWRHTSHHIFMSNQYAPAF